MRLRDMLAAAVRPWVRVHTAEHSAGIELGKSGLWGPWWGFTIDTGGRPFVADGKVVGRVRHGKPLIGDLYLAVHSRRRREREHAEWKAKCAANDSKAAA